MAGKKSAPAKRTAEKVVKKKGRPLFRVSWISEWETLKRSEEQCRYTGVKARVLRALGKTDKEVCFARIRTTSTTDVVSHVILDRIRKSDVVIVDLSAKTNADVASKPLCEAGASFRSSFNPNVLWEFGAAFAFLMERTRLLELFPDERAEFLRTKDVIPNVRAIFVAIRQESKGMCGKLELHRLLPADMLGFYLNTYSIDKKKIAKFDDGRSFAAMMKTILREFEDDARRNIENQAAHSAKN